MSRGGERRSEFENAGHRKRLNSVYASLIQSTRQPRFRALFLPERPSRKGAPRNVLDKSGWAEDVALATLFLASDSSFWVTDVTLDVAGAGSWTDESLVSGSER
jgi:NAD(P)-dependent dehydrogenase (short-subunit alcohol dehydrogenase family)